MANFHRLIVLFFLSFLSFNSFSYVLNIDPGAPLNPRIHQNCKGPGFNYGNLESSLLPSGHFWVSFSNAMNGNCMEAYGTSCPIGTDSVILGRYNRAECVTTNICPENSTKQGGYCVCNAGFEELDNSCVGRAPNPIELCEGVVSFCRDLTSKRSDFLVSASYRPDFVCQPLSITPDVPSNLSECKVRGCNFMTFSGSVSYKDAFNGKTYTGGEGSYTGSTCNTADELPVENPNPPENADKPCKVGYSPGLVNGVRFCAPGSDITTEGPKKSEENADGSTSETTTKTVCNNGECTTTETTTTKDASGNVTGTSSSTTNQTETEFCAKEPGSPFCIGVGSKPGNGLEGSEDGKENGRGTFSGTCDTGFTCKEGDAISCAIAKRLHEDSCTLSKQTEESSLYNQSKGKEGSVTGDLEGNESYGFSNIRSTSRFSESSCFQDLTVSVMGESITLEFSKICPWLSNLGYVLVAVAWIIAATIVMRGRA